LERSLALDGRNHEGLIGLAEVLLAQNDKAQALRIVSKGLRAYPGDRQLLALLAQIET
jgi:cytochrome c-type biogenesis protein CcmH/NrfG